MKLLRKKQVLAILIFLSLCVVILLCDIGL